MGSDACCGRCAPGIGGTHVRRVIRYEHVMQPARMAKDVAYWLNRGAATKLGCGKRTHANTHTRTHTHTHAQHQHITQHTT
jgi:hypothetical protein